MDGFARTGQLGPFALGIDRSEIESILGRKFFYVDVDDLHVLLCDGVVFHCKGRGPLHFLNVVIGEARLDHNSIATDVGIFQPTMALHDMPALLDSAGMSYGDVQTWTANGCAFAKSVLLSSGVQLTFHEDAQTRLWDWVLGRRRIWRLATIDHRSRPSFSPHSSCATHPPMN